MPPRVTALSPLDAPWALGESAYSRILQHLRSIEAPTIVEFGSGASTAALARDLPDATILSVDNDATYFARTRAQLPSNARVELVHCPLTWQRHGGAPYLSYGRCELPEAVDAVLIDGPPHWTRRGREACLYQTMPALKTGGRIFLDDYRRAAERQMVRNWLDAYPSALRLVEVIEEGDRVAVLEKIADAPPPRLTLSRRADAHLQAALQPLTSSVRRIAMRLRGL
ncbi:MAG: class I SAM-dependent methyltransferase [Polyangiales bacterium]